MYKKRNRSYSLLCLPILLGAMAGAWADGPHWYIPEPPDDEYKLIELDEATVTRFKTAMAISGKRQFFEKIARVCVRYLREYERYVAAPDSPEAWHTTAGREQMAGYAVEILRILAMEENVAKFVVEAFAEQIRFQDDLEKGRLSDNMKKLMTASKALNVALVKWNEAFDEVVEENENNVITDKNGKTRKRKVSYTRKQLVNSVDLKDARAGWVEASLVYEEALKLCQNELPRSFIKNMTGDIPFLQDAAQWRLRDALLGMGWPVARPLQKLLKHPSAMVVKQAKSLLSDLGHLLKHPELIPLTHERVVSLLRRLSNPRSKNAMEALKILQKYGDRVLPILLSIAKQKDGRFKVPALGSLYSLTGQVFGERFDRWDKYVNKRMAKLKANSNKRHPHRKKDKTLAHIKKPANVEHILAEEEE